VTNALHIQSDTLTLLLTSRFHQHDTPAYRAIRIAKVCKIIRDRTKDQPLLDACKRIIKSVSAGNYELVIKAVNRAEDAYCHEFEM
jgi:hypothetical protein